MGVDLDDCGGLLVPPTRHSPGSAIRIWLLEHARRALGSPQYERLASSIDEAALQLHVLLSEKAEADQEWARAAKCHLALAKEHLTQWRLEMGWGALEDAKGWMLHARKMQAKFHELAPEVLREAKAKLSGWRLGVVTELLCDDNGKLRKTIAIEPERLIQAKRMLTDHFETGRHRIALRRRHLQIILFVLGLALLALAIAAARTEPETRMDLVLGAVMIGGVIGACISVVQALMKADLDQRIPDQLVGSFAIWIRPVLGCAAAVAAFYFLKANDSLEFIKLKYDGNISVAFAVALLAGYSERFIVGVFGKLSDSLGGK